MSFKKAMLYFLVTCVSIFCNSILYGQQLRLKVAGDKESGFHVDIYDGNQLLVTNTEEFSLHLFNYDLSAQAHLQHWKGLDWSGNEKRIKLQGTSYIPEFDANLSVSVTYEMVTENIIKKKIELFQPSMPGMMYIMQQTARPAETPQRYVTFEYDSFPGGMVHEMFPSAGFITPGNKVVGFLTDAGYKNEYTRNTRRRFSGRGGGFVGMRRLPDANLFSVSGLTERAQNNHFIRQTFGEMLNLDAGKDTVLKMPGDFQKEGNAEVEKDNGLISIKGHPGGRAGIEFVAPFKDQRIYTISFWCKGNTPVALKLFRIKDGHKTIELEDGVKYIDNFPAVESEWTLFKGSILVPYMENDSVSMFIGTASGKECQLQIKDLQFIEHQPRQEPYNILPIGKKVVKTNYIFVEPWKSHQQFMISSQSRLAEAMGFKGTLIEKMLYGNFKMLTWITGVNDLTPFNVPNMNYAPDMYNRDSYFSTIASYNKELNLSIWEQWGKTQTSKGGIGTIITPLMGSVEAKDNEATIEWLIWAMMNKRRFGVILPKEKIKKAVEYVLNEFDADKDGKCKSHFSLSQVD
ncbi:MAG: hypothetical protein ABJA57_13720, partial [Ginsengibacter sp.]